MKSFLLSALSRRYSGSLEKFKADHPYSWVVWEPGDWKPPRANTVTMLAPLQAEAQVDRKSQEALAMALEPKGRVITLGRAPDCDIVINDGTLSGQHLLYSLSREGVWRVEDTGSRNGSAVSGGQKLEPHVAVALKNGAWVSAGRCVLTFHTPEGLWSRLKAP
jgi:hypothetical protein